MFTLCVLVILWFIFSISLGIVIGKMIKKADERT
jgi:glycerol-3-phosphate acyltransferase PlsY